MVEKTILDPGLVIISEYRPEFLSFALSYSVRSGSRAESIETNGFHHFVEHMMFKGSEKYDLKKIADISDKLGGSLNAFTGKEISQYYLKAIDGKLKESFDLLTDIVIGSSFPESEFKNEKSVVLQEIKEYDDDPDTFAFERFYEIVFGDNGLAFPIAGKEDRVVGFSRNMINDFYKKTYLPNTLLLASVGKVKHDELVQLAEKAFAGYPPKSFENFRFEKPGFHFHSFAKRNRALKQVYAIMGFAGIPSECELKYKFMVMTDILGGGMSSRLFQGIREEKGLAYTVNSFLDSYLDCGVHIVYAIIEPGKTVDYFDAVLLEIDRLKKSGIAKEELERAKDHIKSSLILGIESNVAKMNFNVKQELFLGRELQMDEIVENIDRVTADDIHSLFNEYLNLQETAIFLYGNITEKKFPAASILNSCEFL